MNPNYRWRIFWARFTPTLGSEQSGTRPVLIVSAEEVNQSLPIVTVLPFTKARPGRTVYPTEVYLPKEYTGLTLDSIAMAHQIRTIAKERLEQVAGHLADVKLRKEIRQAILRHLGFWRPPLE